MISKEIKDKVWELRKQGMSMGDISIQVKVSKATIHEWCKNFDPNSVYNLTYTNLYRSKDEIIKYYQETSYKETYNKYSQYDKKSIRSLLVSAGVYEGVYKNETPEEISRRKSVNVINWKKNTKLKLIEYKGGGCEVCGYNKCTTALEFHHLNPSLKDFSISNNSYSFDKMKLEVDKCALLCSNCHREVHAGITKL